MVFLTLFFNNVHITNCLSHTLPAGYPTSVSFQGSVAQCDIIWSKRHLSMKSDLESQFLIQRYYKSNHQISFTNSIIHNFSVIFFHAKHRWSSYRLPCDDLTIIWYNYSLMNQSVLQSEMFPFHEWWYELQSVCQRTTISSFRSIGSVGWRQLHLFAGFDINIWKITTISTISERMRRMERGSKEVSERGTE